MAHFFNKKLKINRVGMEIKSKSIKHFDLICIYYIICV